MADPSETFITLHPGAYAAYAAYTACAAYAASAAYAAYAAYTAYIAYETCIRVRRFHVFLDSTRFMHIQHTNRTTQDPLRATAHAGGL